MGANRREKKREHRRMPHTPASGQVVRRGARRRSNDEAIGLHACDRAVVANTSRLLRYGAGPRSMTSSLST